MGGEPERMGVLGPGVGGASALGPGSALAVSPRRGLVLRGWPRPLPAHAQKVLQLSTEVLIEPAVDEGVVACATHGQPVEGEVNGIAAADSLAGQEHHVAVEREPADSEDHDHHGQHLDSLLLLLAVGEVLLGGDVADGVAPPQPAGDCGVGRRDDEER